MTASAARPHNFIGMNIRGTPAMKASAVRHDLKVARGNSDVCVVQEFRWPWYWRTLARLMDVATPLMAWRSSPGRQQGYADPVKGAQAVLWNGKVWRRMGVRVKLLHLGVAGISEHRYLRAVLLEENETGKRCWFVTTHFVVGGDEQRDDPFRKKMLRHNVMVLDHFLRGLKATSHPVICQLDANIHRGSEAYWGFQRMLTKHGAKIHGDHGVEYLFTIDGRKVSVQVVRDWQVPTSALKTDHEGRGITFRLV